MADNFVAEPTLPPKMMTGCRRPPQRHPDAGKDPHLPGPEDGPAVRVDPDADLQLQYQTKGW